MDNDITLLRVLRAASTLGTWWQRRLPRTHMELCHWDASKHPKFKEQVLRVNLQLQLKIWATIMITWLIHSSQINIVIPKQRHCATHSSCRCLNAIINTNASGCAWYQNLYDFYQRKGIFYIVVKYKTFFRNKYIHMWSFKFKWDHSVYCAMVAGWIRFIYKIYWIVKERDVAQFCAHMGRIFTEPPPIWATWPPPWLIP